LFSDDTLSHFFMQLRPSIKKTAAGAAARASDAPVALEEKQEWIPKSNQLSIEPGGSQHHRGD
jgi:hypothetical protein